MANMLDYVAWRGDLSFSDSKFGEVDASIFSMLSYIDYGELCGSREMTMLEAAKRRCPELKNRSIKLGLIIPSENINELFYACAKSNRFGGVRITDYESYTSDEETCQFAAVTMHMPKNRMAIVFRGTDDTIIGWREDFGLAYLDSIPSQARAVDYINRMAQKYPFERIYVCGHSKGGHLSLYAAVNCSPIVSGRILCAYCFDGPGLDEKNVSSKRFRTMQKKLSIFIPQSSFIGIMFEVGDKYTVVNGTRKGAFQHDSFFWEVRGATFEHLDSLSERGKKNEEQFRSTMARMSLADRREFVETFFDVVQSTGAKTLTELTRGGVKHISAILKNYGGLDKQKRELFLGLFLKLFDLKRETDEQSVMPKK